MSLSATKGTLRFRKALKRWLRVHEEQIVTVLIALVALMMFVGFIFWHPILMLIWCEWLKRC